MTQTFFFQIPLDFDALELSLSDIENEISNELTRTSDFDERVRSE